MVMTDPIADFLIRIKNGYLAGKKQVEVPYSKIKEKIAQILVKEGYLKEFKIENSTLRLRSGLTVSEVEPSKFKILKLTLKYEGKKPALEEVRRISKPGLRIYAKAKKIPVVRFGFGITIVSTSSGLMTLSQARKKNLGGEVVCQVW